jgi:hypothetical protein
LVVWEHWLDRDIGALREAGVAELDRIYELLERHGIPKELATEFVRRAFEDISEVRGFLDFARDSLESKQREREGIEADGSLSAEERANLLRHNEKHGNVSHAQWLFMAEQTKRLCVDRFERETGITDPDFYRELFAMAPSVQAAPLSTAMADNEQVATP